MPQGLQIGKVAQETGLGIHAIRFYERKSLLKQPVRGEGGFRLFDSDAIRDLKFIRRAQELGFSLAEIRELLVLRRTEARACSHVRDLLSEKLGMVQQKLDEFRKLQDELKSALRKCDRDLKRRGSQSEKSCPVLQELERAHRDPGGRTRSLPKKLLESRPRSRVHHMVRAEEASKPVRIWMKEC